MKKIKPHFFLNDDTLTIAKNLLGKFLISSIDGKITSGMIIETKAYLGKNDRASHAFAGRRSNRTEILYLEGGHFYVYLCYGLHHLLNIVTQEENEPHGVLIRALQPADGIDIMLKRRHMEKTSPQLTSGPGSLTQALGITTKLSGEPIGNTVWLEDRGIKILPENILATPRIGVAYAKEDALLPYRFRLINFFANSKLKGDDHGTPKKRPRRSKAS